MSQDQIRRAADHLRPLVDSREIAALSATLLDIADLIVAWLDAEADKPAPAAAAVNAARIILEETS